MRPKLRLAVLLLLLPVSAVAQDSLATARKSGPAGERLDVLLRRYESYGFNGAVLVVLKGSIVLLQGYGLADRERGIPNTPATLFEMNSITKTLTSAAILQLEEKGLLRTADSVAKYLGPFPRLKAGVSIDHLANHTSGLVVAGTPLDGATRDAFVASVKDAPIESRPGNHYRYTNAGYSLLAAVIEKVGGERYEDYVREHLLEPAGINGATFRGGNVPGATIAVGYVGTPGDPRPQEAAAYQWGTVGAGGLVATVGDVYRWVVAVTGTSLLSEQSRHKLFTPRPPPREGYGWHMERSAWGTTLIHKGGGSADFASQVLVFPDDSLVVVWASNDLRQLWRRALNTAIPDAALDRQAPLPPPVSRARPDLAWLTGAYDADQGAVYLRAGTDFLYAARRNDAAIPADVMFFPQTPLVYSAFDPAALETMSLQFRRTPDGLLVAEFQRGRRLVQLQKRP
jgi:CubicO group peptidase (beta-lactamase class C family)